MWQKVFGFLAIVGICYIISVFSNATSLFCDHLEDEHKTGFLYALCKVLCFIFTILAFILVLPILMIHIRIALSRPAERALIRKCREQYTPTIEKLTDERDKANQSLEFYTKLSRDRFDEVESLKAEIAALNIIQDEDL